MSNAAPGSIIAIFGMMILITGLVSPLKVSTAELHAPVELTYASVPDALIQELDALERCRDVPENLAVETLSVRKNLAADLLKNESLPEPARNLFKRIADTELVDAVTKLEAFAHETASIKVSMRGREHRHD